MGSESAEYAPKGVQGKDIEERVETRQMPVDLDAEFGGPEARKKLERRLLMKLDLRMSILIIIYILNYVRVFFSHSSDRQIVYILLCYRSLTD